MAERRHRSASWVITRPRPSRLRTMAGPGLAVVTAVAAVSLGAAAAAAGTARRRPRGQSGSGGLGLPLGERQDPLPGPRRLRRPALESGREPHRRRCTTRARTASASASSRSLASRWSTPRWRSTRPPAAGGRPIGPLPARVESLAVEAQFESQTTELDPDSAKLVYVTNVSSTGTATGTWRRCSARAAATPRL